MTTGKGLGTIRYNNVETSPMNGQKEKYLAFYNYYVERGKRIATTLETLDYLTTHEQEYATISKISPAFMAAVINNFWMQAIIELDAFYYTNNDLSFNKFFKYIKSNWNLIFTKEFYEEIHYNNCVEKRQIKFTKKKIFDAVSECENIIEQNKSEIDNLRKLRDNVAAHFADINNKEFSISLDQLIKVFQITEQIINKIGVFYDRVSISLKPINAGDIYQTCHALNMYIKYRDYIIKAENNLLGQSK